MRLAQRWMKGGAVGLLAIAAAGCSDPLALTGPITPACSQPAPLLGTYDPAAPGVIVQYRDGVDPVAETNRLAVRYAFTPTHVYAAALLGFAATLTPDVVASLRCEPSVGSVEYDGVVRFE